MHGLDPSSMSRVRSGIGIGIARNNGTRLRLDLTRQKAMVRVASAQRTCVPHGSDDPCG